MSDAKEQAIKLLKDTSYFHDASADLLEALAAQMIPIHAEKGHIFMDEGELMHNILFLEKGSLVRTKMSVADVPNLRASLRHLSLQNKHTELVKNSVTIDRIEGRGCVTGLLHSCSELAHAYATVSADQDDTVVWILNADAFRETVSQTPQYCLDVLTALSRELRVGSKSLRGLIEKAKGTGGSSTLSAKVIKCLCYDTTAWVSEGFKPAIEAFNAAQVKEHGDAAVQIYMDYTTERLTEQSATYAAGYSAVCLFVNDTASEKVLQTLSLMGVKMIAMRCAGFDRVDTKAATAYGFTVARVPAYSPYAVAEMGVSLLMAVNRKIAKASARVKMANFTLDAGLMGMDIFGKTVGVMGTGKIGQILCDIMFGFGAKLICFDVYESDYIKKKGGTYVSKEELYKQSDVIFLMMPLMDATYHTINDDAVMQMKPGVLLINTSRGGLIDTESVLRGLRAGKIAGVGMDVYEHEQQYFFQDWSARNISDPTLVALLGENNVVLTAHQAFFTKEAVDKIVDTTLVNLADFQNGKSGLSHPNNCIPHS